MKRKTKNQSHFTNRLSKIIASLALCLSILFPSVQVNAYDEAKMEVSPDTDVWTVTASVYEGGPTVPVTLYMIVSEDYARRDFRHPYGFWCEEGNFYYKDGSHETSAELFFWFRSDNADVIEEYDGHEVWLWRFLIEPGTYVFAEPSGYMDISVLNSSLESSHHADNYTTGEFVEVKEGDEVTLYSMFGEWEWREQPEQMKRLIDYAKHREGIIDSVENPHVPEEETMEETSIVIEYEESEEAPKPTQEPPKEPVQATLTQPIQETQVVEESNSSAKFLGIVGIVLIGGFVAFLLIRRNKK